MTGIKVMVVLDPAPGDRLQLARQDGRASGLLESSGQPGERLVLQLDQDAARGLLATLKRMQAQKVL